MREFSGKLFQIVDEEFFVAGFHVGFLGGNDVVHQQVFETAVHAAHAHAFVRFDDGPDVGYLTFADRVRKTVRPEQDFVTCD